MSDRLSAAQISDALEEYRSRLSVPEGQPIDIQTLREASRVADGTSIYLIAHAFIMHVSPSAFPDIAGLEANATERARQHLGKKTGDVILPVTAQGNINGRDFMMIPLCRPMHTGRITGRIQWFLLNGDILAWLREMAELSAPPSPEAYDVFHQNFERLRHHPLTSSRLARAADTGLAALQNGFQPRFTPMHGDFWRGNILRQKGRRFVVIDWLGSRMDGYGLFDLIRFADSGRISVRLLRKEFDAHEAILRGPPEVILTAALGHILGNLGEFPVERFMTMADKCLRLHDRVVASKSAA